MFKTYQYKLVPTKTQDAMLGHALDLCRNLYNCALEQRRSQRIGWLEQSRQLVELKKEFTEYADVSAHVLQNVIRRLDGAFVNFFRRLKQGSTPGYPRFKSQKRYASLQFNNSDCGLVGNRLRLAKIGRVKLRLSRPLPDGSKIKTCSIKRYRGAWYASLVVESKVSPLPINEDVVGIDVGIQHFAALSDGTFIPNQRFCESQGPVLRIAQRRRSRRKQGSRRSQKAAAIVRHIHACIANRRHDFLHKESRRIVNRFGIVAVEDLQIKKMSQGMLSKQIADVGWGLFFGMLSYKAEEAGREFVEVDRRQTSQICPQCGVVQKKPLKERVHKCACGCEMPRDTAAAMIIAGRAGPSGVNVATVACVA